MSFGSMINIPNKNYTPAEICKPAFVMNGFNFMPICQQTQMINYKNIVPVNFLSSNNYMTSGTHLLGALQEEYQMASYVESVKRNAFRGRYYPLELLGHGTFGKVYKCHDLKTNGEVALKIIELQGKTTVGQTLMEIRALEVLNSVDVGNQHFVQVLDYFSMPNAQCIVFELLPCSLYERLVSTTGMCGFKMPQLKNIAFQLIVALAIMLGCSIVHCDLKPENIMVATSKKFRIKIADLGSSCYDGKEVFAYIQSRFYRAPEVILQIRYGSPIDVWSSGCLLAELSTGKPLFNGRNHHDQLSKILEYMGPLPQFMIVDSPKCNEYFMYDQVSDQLEFKVTKNIRFGGYYSKSLGGYLLSNKSGDSFEDKLLYNGFSGIDDSFENFIFSMLNMNPNARATPYDLILHPFLYDIVSDVINESEAPSKQRCQSNSNSSRKRKLKHAFELNRIEERIVLDSVSYVTSYFLKFNGILQLQPRNQNLPMIVCNSRTCSMCTKLG